MLEDIEQLKKYEAKSVAQNCTCSSPLDAIHKEIQDLIDKAIRIASEHHLRKVEEDFVKVVKEAVEHPTEPEASDEYRAGHSRACDASRQAHEELTGEVKTE